MNDTIMNDTIMNDTIMNDTIMNDTTVKFNLIVAVCNNYGIGKNGNLPWKIKMDMEYFYKNTTKLKQLSDDNHNHNNNNNHNPNNTFIKNAVIMGHNTWKSLPKKHAPLLKRDNLILSSTLKIDTQFNDKYCIKSFNTIDDIIHYCITNAIQYDTIWIIGGSSIYKQFLEKKVITDCYVTYINKEYECDTFFEKLPEKEWTLISNDSVITDDAICVEFKIFRSIFI